MGTQKIQDALRAPRPIAPPGFVWQLYGDAAFLKPAAWHERERVSTTDAIDPMTVSTYTVSHDPLCEETEFEIGLTAQVIRDSKKILGIDAKQMARGYLEHFLSACKKEEVLRLERYIKGGRECTFFRFTYTPPSQKPGIVHKFILANKVTDCVHVFSFESPAPSWDENWAQYGAPIFRQLLADSILPVPFTGNNVH